MNKNKRYILIITIVASVGFSFYAIAQSFLSKTNNSSLLLMVPMLVLIIPIAIIFKTIVAREIRYRKSLANGVKSVGFIKDMVQTGNYLKKQPEVKIELDILDQNGNIFFGEVTTVVRLVELDFLKKGEPVPVIYKIHNKKEISIDRKPDIKKLKDKIEDYRMQGNIN